MSSRQPVPENLDGNAVVVYGLVQSPGNGCFKKKSIHTLTMSNNQLQLQKGNNPSESCPATKIDLGNVTGLVRTNGDTDGAFRIEFDGEAVNTGNSKIKLPGQSPSRGSSGSMMKNPLANITGGAVRSSMEFVTTPDFLNKIEDGLSKGKTEIESRRTLTGEAAGLQIRDAANVAGRNPMMGGGPGGMKMGAKHGKHVSGGGANTMAQTKIAQVHKATKAGPGLLNTQQSSLTNNTAMGQAVQYMNATMPMNNNNNASQPPTGVNKNLDEFSDGDLEEESDYEEEDRGGLSHSTLVNEVKEVLLMLEMMTNDLDAALFNVEEKYGNTSDLNPLSKNANLRPLDFSDEVVKRLQVVLFGLDLGCQDLTNILQELEDANDAEKETLGEHENTEARKIATFAEHGVEVYSRKLSLVANRVPGILKGISAAAEAGTGDDAANFEEAKKNLDPNLPIEQRDYVVGYKAKPLGEFGEYAKKYAVEAGVELCGANGELVPPRPPVSQMKKNAAAKKKFNLERKESTLSTKVTPHPANKGKHRHPQHGMGHHKHGHQHLTDGHSAVKTSARMILEDPIDNLGVGKTGHVHAVVDTGDIDVGISDVLVPETASDPQNALNAYSFIGGKPDSVTVMDIAGPGIMVQDVNGKLPPDDSSPNRPSNTAAGTFGTGFNTEEAMLQFGGRSQVPEVAVNSPTNRAYGSLSGTGIQGVGGDLEDLVQYLVKPEFGKEKGRALRTIVHSFENKVTAGEVAQLLIPRTERDWVFVKVLRQEQSHWIPSWCLSKGYFRAQFDHETVCRRNHQLEYLKGPCDGWCLVRNVSKKRVVGEWVPVFVLPDRAFEIRPKEATALTDDFPLGAEPISSALHSGMTSPNDGPNSVTGTSRQAAGDNRFFAAFHSWTCPEFGSTIKRGDDLMLMRGPSRGWLHVRVATTTQELFVPYWVLPPGKRPTGDMVSESVIQGKAHKTLSTLRKNKNYRM